MRFRCDSMRFIGCLFVQGLEKRRKLHHYAIYTWTCTIYLSLDLLTSSEYRDGRTGVSMAKILREKEYCVFATLWNVKV